MAARKLVRYEDFFAGMFGDKYLAPKGGIFKGEGISTRFDSKAVTIDTRFSDRIQLDAQGTALFGQIATTTSGALWGLDTGTKWRTYGSYITALTTYKTKLFIIGQAAIHTANYTEGSSDNGVGGNQIITDPDFATGTGWTASGHWSITGGNAVGAGVTTADTGLTFNYTFGVNKVYFMRVQISAISGTGTGLRIQIPNSAGADVFVNIGTTTGQKEVVFTMPATGTYATGFQVTSQTGTVNATVGYFEIYETTFLDSQYLLPNALQGSASKFPVVYNGDFYLAANNTIGVLRPTDPTGTTLAVACTLNSDETIKFMTVISDQFYIFTNKRQYLWDGITENPSRVIDWTGYTIIAGVNKGGICYVMTQDTYMNTIWQVQDVSKTPVVKGLRIDDYGRLYFGGSSIITSSQQMGTSGELVIFPSLYGLFTWGTLSPFQKPALYKRMNPRGTVYCIDGNRVLFRKQNNEYWYGTWSNAPTYKDAFAETYVPASLEVMPNFGDAFNTKKKQIKWRARYDIPISNVYLRFYKKRDDNKDDAIFTFIVNENANAIATLPTAGAVYTHNSSTFTVRKVERYGSTVMIQTKRTAGTDKPSQTTFTLTKSSGTGSSTITFAIWHEYEHLYTAKTVGEKRKTLNTVGEFYSIQFRIELYTTSSSYTPSFYDFRFLYNEIEEDII